MIIVAAGTLFSGEPYELTEMLHAWADGPPETIHIPADYSTIQEGISAALPGDTILVSPGTFFENIDFLGKAVVITSVTGADSTVIDGGGLGSVVTAASGEPAGAEISGFTIMNGDNDTGYGGGVLCENSCELRIFENRITFNHASWGGGIGIIGTSQEILLNTIVLNSAEWDGGAFYGENCVVLCKSNIISNNVCGGVFLSNSLGEISLNQIEQNTWCGGLSIYNCPYVMIMGNVVCRNDDWLGGGIAITDSDSSYVMNNLFTENSSDEKGANIHLRNISKILLVNNLILFGIGSGGIYIDKNVSDYIIEYNDVYGNDGFDYFNVEPGIGNMSFDPLLDEEYKLDWRSPCIDMGDPSMTPPPTGGGRIDIGASEFPYHDDPPVSIEGLSTPDTVETGSTIDWSLSIANGSGQSRYVDCFVSLVRVDNIVPVYQWGFFVGPGETKTIEEEFTFDEFFHAGDWEIVARIGQVGNLLYELDRKDFFVFRAPRLINVPGDFDAIQPAIEAAVKGDTILVSAGTFEGAVDFLGKGIIIASEAGMDSTEVRSITDIYGIYCKGGGGGRGVLKGFTVRGTDDLNTGLFADDFALTVLECRFSDWERAVICTGISDVRLDDCEIIENDTGILAEESANLELSGCDVRDNYESGGGFAGGVGCTGFSTCLIRNSRIINNDIHGYPPFYYGRAGGLGLEDAVHCKIENSEVISNRADADGGIQVLDDVVLEISNSVVSGNSPGGLEADGNCAITVESCLINGNSALDRGGGLHIHRHSSAMILNSEIRGNSASPRYESMGAYGGGIDFTSDAEVIISNCRIIDNVCSGGSFCNHIGGGLHKSGEGLLVLENTEISGNYLGRISGGGANAGAGAFIYEDVGISYIANTVFYANTIYEGDGEGGGLEASDNIYVFNSVFWGNIPDQIDNNPTVVYSNIEDGWPGEGNIDADPLFVSPEEGHFSLLSGSPCIDTGDPELPDPDGTRSDMGAYGGPAAKPVNMTLPVTELSASPGDTIEFEIFLTNSTDTPLSVTVHAILRSRADLADVRLLGNGGMPLAANAFRRVTASGVVSPDLEPGDYYIHLYVVNDLQNDPIEFSNIELEVSG